MEHVYKSRGQDRGHREISLLPFLLPLLGTCLFSVYQFLFLPSSCLPTSWLMVVTGAPCEFDPGLHLPVCEHIRVLRILLTPDAFLDPQTGPSFLGTVHITFC